MRLLPVRLSGQELCPQTTPVRLLRFYFLTKLLRVFPSCLEVLIYLLPVSQKIGDHPVYIGQLKGRIVVGKVLWAGAILELTDHHVQQHLALPYPNDSIFVRTQGDRIRLKRQPHGQFLLQLGAALQWLLRPSNT